MIARAGCGTATVRFQFGDGARNGVVDWHLVAAASNIAERGVYIAAGEIPELN